MCLMQFIFLQVIHDLNETEMDATIFSKEVVSEKAKVLKAEWFWTSIQIDACADETPYLMLDCKNSDDQGNTSALTPVSFMSPPMGSSDGGPGTPGSAGTPESVTEASGGSRRKRKRGRELLRLAI